MAEKPTCEELELQIKTLKKEISIYKTKEKALKKSEEKYRILFEKSKDAILIIENQKFVDCNLATVEMLGYKNKDELIKTHPSELSPPHQPDGKDSFSKAEEMMAIALKKGSHRFEWHHVGANGRIFPVEVLLTTISAQKDNQVIHTIWRDITDRKKAEENLQESIHRYKSLTDNLSVGVYRNTTGPKGKFVEANPALLKMFGYDSREDFFQLNVSDLYKDPEDRKDLNEKLIKNGELKNEAIQLIKKDKTPFIGSITAVAVTDKDGNPRYFDGIIEDVTERKNMEKEKEALESRLRQAERMEAIGTLAGGIAHDFNNILFPIIGYTEMLIHETPESSPVRKKLDGIYKASIRARELVKQILTFSRHQNNELKEINLQPILKETLKLLRATIPTSINIRQEISKDNCIVRADPMQVHQIIMNLTTNACDALLDSSGELTFSLKPVQFDKQDVLFKAMEPGAYACLTVADTGSGIETDVVGKIFDPFFTTKALGKGTGMGLSVVHGIVKNAGGHIQVKSEKGKGTCFQVYLPLLTPDIEKKIPQPIHATGSGNETIMLVDDEKDIAEMVSQMLRHLGYRAISFTKSNQALDAFKKEPDLFDLVITDMTMPFLSGDKLTFELKKIRPDIPVILCTGFSKEISEDKSLAMGIEGFLMKPVTMNDVAETIRKVLKTHKILYKNNRV